MWLWTSLGRDLRGWIPAFSPGISGCQTFPMPRLRHPGVDLLAAYLTLEIVAGYGYDKAGGGASATWTIMGLIAGAMVVLGLEVHARRHEPRDRGPDRG